MSALPTTDVSGAGPRSGPAPDWWRAAVIYQVYPRSFADGDSDGVGDISGISQRLGYLAELGIDAIWITPWYPSPWVDGGYDITGYCAIDPCYGSLADADELIQAAHQRGIRVLIDLVANHTSDQHPWFKAALDGGRGHPARARYWFRDGRGSDGSEPPNNWTSRMGTSIWSRVPDGQWYLHSFAPQQPDLNWNNREVRDQFERILRFWFDRGVDGFRVDAVPAMGKDPTLVDDTVEQAPGMGVRDHSPSWDGEAVHEILREWRRLGDHYVPARFFQVEAVVATPQRFGRYLRPDEMQSGFVFDFLYAGWDAAAVTEAVTGTLAALESSGGLPTWALASHDETRAVTRLGRLDTTAGSPVTGVPSSDRELGLRRAKAFTLLMLTLPGLVSIYQGEELGLDEVEDLPDEFLAHDPIWESSLRTVRGRTGCRVPLPWRGEAPPFGFTESAVTPWLPQPEGWAEKCAERQAGQPGSTLGFHRAALALRRDLHRAGRLGESLLWRDAPDEVIDVARGDLRCIINMGKATVTLPPHARERVALWSDEPGDPTRLPPDSAVWLVRGEH